MGTGREDEGELSGSGLTPRRALSRKAGKSLAQNQASSHTWASAEAEGKFPHRGGDRGFGAHVGHAHVPVAGVRLSITCRPLVFNVLLLRTWDGTQRASICSLIHVLWAFFCFEPGPHHGAQDGQELTVIVLLQPPERFYCMFLSQLARACLGIDQFLSPGAIGKVAVLHAHVCAHARHMYTCAYTQGHIGTHAHTCTHMHTKTHAG